MQRCWQSVLATSSSTAPLTLRYQQYLCNHLLLVHCEVHAPGGELHIMRTLMPLPSGQQMHDKHRYNQRPDDMQPRVATQLAPE